MAEALRSDLGLLEAGSTVSVDISGMANVRLIESDWLLIAQFGWEYIYYGGLYGPGTVTIRVPEDGHWCLVIDTKDLDGWGSVSVSPPRITGCRLAAA